jgi:hypothetical protein
MLKSTFHNMHVLRLLIAAELWELISHRARPRQPIADAFAVLRRVVAGCSQSPSIVRLSLHRL